MKRFSASYTSSHALCGIFEYCSENGLLLPQAVLWTPSSDYSGKGAPADSWEDLVALAKSCCGDLWKCREDEATLDNNTSQNGTVLTTLPSGSVVSLLRRQVEWEIESFVVKYYDGDCKLVEKTIDGNGETFGPASWSGQTTQFAAAMNTLLAANGIDHSWYAVNGATQGPWEAPSYRHIRVSGLCPGECYGEVKLRAVGGTASWVGATASLFPVLHEGPVEYKCKPCPKDKEKPCCIPVGEEFPETPEPLCETTIVEGCDDLFTDDTADDVPVFAALTDCGNGIVPTYFTLNADNSTSEYELVGNFLPGCEECKVVEFITRCDANGRKVTFIRKVCADDTIILEGPFILDTDVPDTEAVGPFAECECEVRNIVKCDRFKVPLFYYEWDNGYHRSTPRYDTGHGQVVDPSDGTTLLAYQGFIDQHLRCGTATIDEIYVGGTNVLPNPVVDTTTSGTWGPLNTLLWTTLQSLGFSTPPGIGCDRPPVTPSTNCFGRSTSCQDIDLEYFTVTDCRGVRWGFRFQKEFLGETEVLRTIYYDCDGNLQCEWTDAETKAVIPAPDPNCLEPCIPEVTGPELQCIAEAIREKGGCTHAMQILNGRLSSTATYALHGPDGLIFEEVGAAAFQATYEATYGPISTRPVEQVWGCCPPEAIGQPQGTFYTTLDGNTHVKSLCEELPPEEQTDGEKVLGTEECNSEAILAAILAQTECLTKLKQGMLECQQTAKFLFDGRIKASGSNFALGSITGATWADFVAAMEAAGGSVEDVTLWVGTPPDDVLPASEGYTVFCGPVQFSQTFTYDFNGAQSIPLEWEEKCCPKAAPGGGAEDCPDLPEIQAIIDGGNTK